MTSSTMRHDQTSTQLNSTSANTSLPQTGSVRHHPQVLDRDTELFKSRLETMLNNFKIDTMTEYMEAKRHLLEEQAGIISGEKTQYELKLNSKITEVRNSFSMV